ncbi:MAG: glycosyltransferase family 39 protein [Acidimicrobiia bacterium]
MPAVSSPEHAGHGDAAPSRGPRLSTFHWWLLGAIALGLVVRLIFVLHYKWDQAIAGDAAYYHFQANALAKGLGFVDPWSWSGWDPINSVVDPIRKTGVHPGAEHPPLYTMFLAIPSRLGFDTFRQHLLAGGILGSLTCGAVGFAGRAVAGTRVGIVAAFITAVYANLWINDGLVQSETIAAFMVALVVLCTYRFWREPSWKNAALFGLSCGVVALTRAEIIFLAPMIALPLALRARGHDLKRRLQLLGVMILVAAIPVVPWVGYNLARFNQPVTLSTGGDFTLANTYCETTFYGERLGWWDLRCVPDRWALPGDESDVSAEFREQGLDYLTSHLSRYPVVLAARIGRMWEIYKPFQKLGWDEYEGGRNPAVFNRLALGQFYALALLAIAGLVMLRRRKIIIYPFIALAITASISAMLAFGSTRYRVSAEIALVIAASVPLAELLNRWFPSDQDPAPESDADPDDDDAGGQTSEVSSSVRASNASDSV